LVFVLILVGKRAVVNKWMFLKPLLLIHNLVLLVVHLYLVIEIIREALRNEYSLWCNEFTEGIVGKQMANLFWLFYWAKALELLSVLYNIALKKPFSTVSTMLYFENVFFAWWVVFFAPHGEAYFPIILNSALSVVVSAHYLIVDVARTKWLAQSLHSLIILQCLSNVVQVVYNAKPSCTYPETIRYPFVLYNVIAMCFFLSKMYPSDNDVTTEKKDK